nr:protein ALTERED XYLOGLUCAN 4-like [Coffea arabica]
MLLFRQQEKIFILLSRPLLLICSVCFTILLIFYALRAPDSINFTAKNVGYVPSNSSSSLHPPAKEDEKCNLFKGRWIWDEKGPLYTNFSCKTIPDKKNCFLHERMDKDFVHWRWKPDECELPVFDPRSFLSIARGKTMAFIGDSVSRNQMESLLCLLSTEETPKDVYKDAKDRFRTWHFPHYNFTMMSLWSRFLVTSSQTIVNGSVTGGFDVHLDKVDDNWAPKLPVVDYAIFSDAQWFLRQNYLYEGGNLIGCIYCQEPNVTDLGPGFAIQRAFRTAFNYINDCKNCFGILTLLRTISPSQFENGTWKTGGSCVRTSPLAPEEIQDAGGTDMEYRNIQMAEIESARKRGEKIGNRFDVLDVTGAMLMRPDGHPGLHWRNKKKGYSDCVHWCMPGPIDVWNEFLLEVLRRQSHFPLRSR